MARGRPLFEVDGVGLLIRDLRRAGVQINKQLGAENKRIGEKVIRRARGRAPVGPAPTHIKDQMRAASNARQVMVRMGGARRGVYAPIVHWGSRYRPRTAPQPFLADAALAMEAEVTADYLDAIERVTRSISAS